MKQRMIAIYAVALLFALAGCGPGGPLGPTLTPTPTQTPTPTHTGLFQENGRKRTSGGTDN